MTSVTPSNQAPDVLSQAAGSWKLDPSSTTIDLRTKAMWGLVPVKGSLKALEGHGTVTEDGAVNGTLVIDASSIDTGNKKRDTHLRSDDFFNTETYPTFVFTATGATGAGDDKVKVGGTLTISGQTKPLETEATLAHSAEGYVTVTSHFEIDRSQWGVSWSKMGAKVLNQVTVSARFTKS